MQLLEGVGEPAQRASGASLDGAERDVQEIGDLGLREPAPVSELEQGALVLGQLLQGPMDAPGEPGALRLVRRARFRRGLVGHLGRSFRLGARAVDNCVSRHRVEPRSARASLGPVARGGAPDRRERLLGRVLGAAAVAETAQREREHWPYEAAVEDVERLAVAVGNSLQQLAVAGAFSRGRAGLAVRRLRGEIECELHVLVSTRVHAAPDWSRRPPSTTSEVPVTKPAPARKTTASATSSGDPTRPSSVCAARRSAWSGSTATGPGATPQTRTSGASARANTRVSIACAALAAQCAANEGQG